MSHLIKGYVSRFPAMVLTGARQVGKTTILRAALKKSHKYVLLEDPDIRSQAMDDPRTFLERFPAPVIFDEFQYVPELTSYLQGIIDNEREKMGQYVLTGSQNFLMMEQVSQSLAGRAGILSLYGLTAEEIPLRSQKKDSFAHDSDIAKLIHRGTFPELWARPEVIPFEWYGSYLRTYIERDVRNLTQVADLTSFERFVRLCAIRTGQLLNVSELARDTGISQPTANRWLSILRSTYQVHLIEPFYENLTSRIKKSPKLYFLDTGLAAYLMGFRDESLIVSSPQFGALFETLVITNFIKESACKGEVPEHYFLETKSGKEVDLIVRSGTLWDLYEVKARRTFKTNDLKQIIDASSMFGDKAASCNVLAPVEEEFTMSGVNVRPWTQTL